MQSPTPKQQGGIKLVPKKYLGQHWLKDRSVLDSIVEFAGVSEADTVLEIGPGLGTLTSALLRRAGKVLAVEYDSDLAIKLPAQFPGKNLEVIPGDILQFDLSVLPKEYKVVANLPYYITSKIIMFLLASKNRPATITVLVQKEVAERIAQVGGSSILALAVENWAVAELGQVVPAELFTPPPQVDSQVIKLTMRSEPIALDEKAFMRVVKAGFSEKRKKLRSSLSGGLAISVSEAESVLGSAGIDPNKRAQELSFDDFSRLVEALHNR